LSKVIFNRPNFNLAFNFKQIQINDGARIFATSKENLSIIDEPSSVTLKNNNSVLGRQKYSEGAHVSNQKRSHTSINVG
jgi:hypothetical protein